MTHVWSPPTIEMPSTPTLVTENVNPETAPESTPVTQFPEIPPVFDIQHSADEAHDTPFLDAWTNHLNAQQSQVNVERVSVHASNVQGAAHSLWSAIMALANNRDLPEQEVGCDVDCFTMEAIMNGSPQVHVYVAHFFSVSYIILTSSFRGDSVGNGVLRAIWSTMWCDVLSLGCGERFWTNNDDNFVTISLQNHVLATHITEEEEAYLWGCGFWVRVSIIWGLMPGPLSPSLVLYLAYGNIDQAISQDFLIAVQPAIEARLQTWPPSRITRDRRTVLDLDVRRDPWTLIASCVSFDGTRVCFHFLSLPLTI